MTASPARNLPLMTSSRWIGCDTSRGRVPSARSELIASKPNAIPSSGPRKPTSATNDGSWAVVMFELGFAVKSARNTPRAPLAPSATSRMEPATE